MADDYNPARGFLPCEPLIDFAERLHLHPDTAAKIFDDCTFHLPTTADGEPSKRGRRMVLVIPAYRKLYQFARRGGCPVEHAYSHWPPYSWRVEMRRLGAEQVPEDEKESVQ